VSRPALLFAIYFIVGLLLMVAAVAMRGKERCASLLDASDGTQLGAGLLIFVALLWPLWLLGLLIKSGKGK